MLISKIKYFSECTHNKDDKDGNGDADGRVGLGGQLRVVGVTPAVNEDEDEGQDGTRTAHQHQHTVHLETSQGQNSKYVYQD